MNKILGIIAVGLLLFGFAGQSMALPVGSNLYRVIYDASTNTEYVWNLGTIGGSTITASNGVITADLNYTVAGSAFDLHTFFGATAQWSDLTVAYLTEAATISGVASQLGSIWVSSDGAASVQRKGSTFSSAFTTINYAPAVGSYATGSTTDPLSYLAKMDPSGGAGTFNFLLPNSSGEIDLTGQIVNSYLYFYTGNFANNLTPVLSATLRLNADGSTTINPSAVPIPPSMLLLGSGLLGLIGLRRKSA